MHGDNGIVARTLESWLAHATTTTREVLPDNSQLTLLDPIFHGDRRLRFFLGLAVCLSYRLWFAVSTNENS